MIHLNIKPSLDNRTHGIAKKEAEKRKVSFGYFNSEQIKSYDEFFNKIDKGKPINPLDYFGVILFDKAAYAPLGHTENSPLLDVAKALSANGVEVYINAAADSHIAKEFLAKTACNLIGGKK